MKELLSSNLITILLISIGFIGTWYTLKSDSRWHTTWIKKHSEDCDEYRKINAEVLTEIRTTNAHLVTLTEAHDHRLGRLEQQADRGRSGR